MSLGTLLCSRPAEKPENYIFVGLIATVAVGGGHAVLTDLGVIGAKALTELLAFIVCMRCFPRETHAPWSSRLTLCLIAAGVGGAGLWIAIVGYPEREAAGLIDWSRLTRFNYVLGVVTSCIVAPLFEEKVVRHLLLSGASHYLGKFLATLAVSVLFAWPHIGNEIFAFIFSVTLCLNVYLFKLDSWQRALIHGILNLVIIQWELLQ